MVRVCVRLPAVEASPLLSVTAMPNDRVAPATKSSRPLLKTTFCKTCLYTSSEAVPESVRAPVVRLIDLLRADSGPEPASATSKLSPLMRPAVKVTVAEDRVVESTSAIDRDGAMATPAAVFSMNVTAAGESTTTGLSLTAVMPTVTVEAAELSVLSKGSTTA